MGPVETPPSPRIRPAVVPEHVAGGAVLLMSPLLPALVMPSENTTRPVAREKTTSNTRRGRAAAMLTVRDAGSSCASYCVRDHIKSVTALGL